MNSEEMDAIVRHIRANEGVKTNIYADSKGILTTGGGQNICNRDTFIEQPFRTVDGKDYLTAEQKSAAFDGFQAAKAKNPNLNPEKYEGFKNIEFPSNLVDSRIADHVLADEANIRKTLGNDPQGVSYYDKAPLGQRTVLHDVAYAKGSINGFDNLKNALKEGNSAKFTNNSVFHSGTDENGKPTYNFDRLSRNMAASDGISFEEAQKKIANQFPNHPHLPSNYKSLITPKSSDAGPTADPPQVTQAEGTTTEETAAPAPFAPMNQALNEQTALDAKDAGLPPPETPPTLLGQADPDDSTRVPGDMKMPTYAQDITGDSHPMSFAPMSTALNEASGYPPDPTLLGDAAPAGNFA